MNAFDDSASLNRARREARRLLKDLRQDEYPRAAAAARRFLKLRTFAALDPADLASLRRRTHLKHALALIAEERGHPSWPAFKRAAAAPAPEFYAPVLAGFLFRWFVDPEEAATSRREMGGYVLPFDDHCFVCEADAVRELGLDPSDPDWRTVGFDLVRPEDDAARERLLQKRRAAIRAGVGVPAPRPLPWRSK